MDLEFKKKYSEIKKKAEFLAKNECCLICSVMNFKMCKSHNIPLFCLKKISNDGYLYDANILLDPSNAMNNGKKIGIKKINTFQNICTKCDNEIFKSIETVEIFETEELWSQKNLNKLALKQTLHYYNRRLIELEQIKQTKLPNDHVLFGLDYWWYYDVINIEKYLHEILDSKLNLKYIKVLDYITDKEVNFAFSAPVVLKYDYNGTIINQTNLDANYNKQFGFLHIGVFPFSEEKSRILMFFRKKNFEYQSLISTISECKNMETKLKIVSDLILLQSDQIIFNESLLKKLKEIDFLFRIDANNVVDSHEYNRLRMLIKDINLFS